MRILFVLAILAFAAGNNERNRQIANRIMTLLNYADALFVSSHYESSSLNFLKFHIAMPTLMDVANAENDLCELLPNIKQGSLDSWSTYFTHSAALSHDLQSKEGFLLLMREFFFEEYTKFAAEITNLLQKHNFAAFYKPELSIHISNVIFFIDEVLSNDYDFVYSKVPKKIQKAIEYLCSTEILQTSQIALFQKTRWEKNTIRLYEAEHIFMLNLYRITSEMVPLSQKEKLREPDPKLFKQHLETQINSLMSNIQHLVHCRDEPQKIEHFIPIRSIKEDLENFMIFFETEYYRLVEYGMIFSWKIEKLTENWIRTGNSLTDHNFDNDCLDHLKDQLSAIKSHQVILPEKTLNQYFFHHLHVLENRILLSLEICKGVVYCKGLDEIEPSIEYANTFIMFEVQMHQLKISDKWRLERILKIFKRQSELLVTGFDFYFLQTLKTVFKSSHIMV